MPVVVTWYSNFWPKATFVLLEEEPEGELEIEISSEDDEDELSVLSLELSSDFALQDESNTAMMTCRTNQGKYSHIFSTNKMLQEEVLKVTYPFY